jgi:hypothetical protein
VAPIKKPVNQLSVSLATPGYEFDVITYFTGAVQVIVDPTSPVFVPFVKTVASTNIIVPEPLVPPAPGFLATFNLVNNTTINRVFTFPIQYWADNKIVLSIYDSTDTLIWQSVPLPVDIPPLAQPVNLTLKAKSNWSATVFIPLKPDNILLADGQYVLQATLSGTPEFSASASFEVKNIKVGPIVDPLPPVMLSGSGN